MSWLGRGGDDQDPVEPEEPWTPWRVRLGDAVLALADGDSLVLTATGTDPRPAVVRPSRLRGLIPGKTTSVHPYVRLVRQEEMLRGECVAAVEDGGVIPLTDEERARAVDLGWHVPTAMDEVHYVRWWPDDVPTEPYLAESLVASASTCVERTVRLVFGCRGPGEVTGLPEA